MSEANDWVELKKTIKLYAIWAITSLADALFLTLWVAVQWVVGSKVVTPLRLSGIDSIVLSIFQVLFAVSTLAPVAITIYRDIRIMLLRTQRKIRQEIRIGEANESQ
jgi:hypothetical protein